MKKHKVFLSSGLSITLPEAFTEVVMVFRDSARLIEGRSPSGYNVTNDGIDLSEQPDQNNSQGGQEYVIFYR